MVYMCMTKMNHQMQLAKFQHQFWTPCSFQLQGFGMPVFSVEENKKNVSTQMSSQICSLRFCWYSSVVELCS